MSNIDKYNQSFIETFSIKKDKLKINCDDLIDHDVYMLVSNKNCYSGKN